MRNTHGTGAGRSYGHNLWKFHPMRGSNLTIEIMPNLPLWWQNFPRNRAALSLLSYCYYQMQDYKAATTMYEQLVKVCPSVEEYKVRMFE